LLIQTLRCFIIQPYWKLALFLALCCLSGMARSQIDDPISQRLEKIYSSKSNQEISELLSSWASLSPLERRFLLAETRGRLNGEKRKDFVKDNRIRVRVDRRYGSSVSTGGVTKFQIRTEVNRKIEGGIQPSSTASRIEGLSESRTQAEHIKSRRQSLFTETRAEFRSVTYGSGFERRVSGEGSSALNGHKNYEAVQVRKKAQ
jgi:hypothetical protein